MGLKSKCLDDPVSWAALAGFETQSIQDTEDEGTCKQSITRCRALFCKAGVWHSVKEAYKHIHPHRQQYKLKHGKICKDAHKWGPISEKRVNVCSSG